MKITFVTVNYLQVDRLHDMLISIQRMKINKNSDEIEVIITNNCEDVILSNEYDIKIQVIEEGNIGYLKGLKKGVEHTAQDYNNNDHVVILCNPDLIFPPDFVDRVKANLFYISSGIVGPDICCNGRRQNPNKRKQPTKLWYLIHDLEMYNYLFFYLIRAFKSVVRAALKCASVQSIEVETHQNSEVYLLHGSCMITTLRNIYATRCLHYDIFLWGEEAVICSSYRIRDMPIWYCPSIKVKHMEHTATGMLQSKRKYQIWKKSSTIYRKHL